MVCGYQCYNPLEKVSGFNDVLFPSFKGFKCVTQFITLFQKSRKNQNKIEPVERFYLHYRMLIRRFNGPFSESNIL